MLFNSYEFLVFFPATVVLYFFLPHRMRWPFLLLGSCVFYMSFAPRYILLLAFTITVNYVAGLLIERTAGRMRRVVLIAAIVLSLGNLAFFKYYSFIVGSLESLFAFVQLPIQFPSLRILLPIGITFFTFQALSYTIEVYWGHQKAERHFGIFALFISFWPQLVAGPIERPQNLLRQFYEHHKFEPGRVADGLKLMALGMFKKVLIADSLALFVDKVYGQPDQFGGLALLLGTVFFTFQIYYDFSGYSDIAIGAARVMGFSLMKNFDAPYLAASVTEFWRRWHISLSTWFRDYVYIPLGGNRVSKWRYGINIMVVFMVSGLWHGAAWKFVVWGALHGLYVIIEVSTSRLRERIRFLLRIRADGLLYRSAAIVTTFICVVLALIFFRAESAEQGLVILQTIVLDLPAQLRALSSVSAGLPLSAIWVAGAVVVLAVMMVLDHIDHRAGLFNKLSAWPLVIRFTCYLGLVYLPLFVGEFGGPQEFIYFQF